MEHAIWLAKIFSQMQQSGPEGKSAVDYLRSKGTKLGFKSTNPNVGAFWTVWKNIYLNSHHYSYEKSVDNPRVVTLLIHETKHLQQGLLTALSVYGELEAWQLEWKIYHRMIGRYPRKAIEDLMALPLSWDREVLKKAVELMQAYSGKGYRIDLLPLYPIGKEIRYKIFGTIPKTTPA